ncbi:unnamed protein product [Soboliphyme baturini]|uniref:Secreted protein n=1 Tax=Soboliphyme baturini TaxID=241478 RepID=A0A183IAV2_9BILA|nr:unnamed protein product [Soboliphyme baturini]
MRELMQEAGTGAAVQVTSALRDLFISVIIACQLDSCDPCQSSSDGCQFCTLMSACFLPPPSPIAFTARRHVTLPAGHYFLYGAH